jgi:conjugative relaxase-like TrwC/TraI family protein
MRAGRRVGYDFNFHACKSASLLYALTEDEDILSAFVDSVRSVMIEMERRVKARVRKRGQSHERTVGNMAWAEFPHFTARPVAGVIDPHLHLHCFVPNCCYDQVEGMWKAIDVASIQGTAPHWQAKFQRRFGLRLAALGYPVAWNGDAFEIEGVERATIEKFSSRTRHINRVAEDRGITDAAAKGELGALTRERKRKDATMPQLRAQWRDRLTDEERSALGQLALRRRRLLPGGRAQDDHHTRTRERQRREAHAQAMASPSPAPQAAASYGR